MEVRDYPEYKDYPFNCPTCGSKQPHLHPAVQHEGEVNVCPDVWHSSTHLGRATLTQVIGHAYYSQYVQYIQEVREKLQKEMARGVIPSEFILAGTFPGLSGKKTEPDGSPLPGTRPATAGGPIAGSERDGATMPDASEVSERPNLSHRLLGVLQNDLLYAQQAMNRLRNSTESYLAYVNHEQKSETGKVSVGKVPDSVISGPKHGDIISVKGDTENWPMVYLASDDAPDGRGWYPIGAFATLVDNTQRKVSGDHGNM